MNSNQEITKQEVTNIFQNEILSAKVITSLIMMHESNENFNWLFTMKKNQLFRFKLYQNSLRWLHKKVQHVADDLDNPEKQKEITMLILERIKYYNEQLNVRNRKTKVNFETELTTL